MLKKIFLPILISALMGSLLACNSKTDDDEYTIVQSASVAVTAFHLQNDKKILDSLANVFFSIDLVNASIFNADSLPYGTKVTRLIPSITVPSTSSKVELKFYSTDTRRDSVVNYLTNSTDSIDFTNPVTLTVVSQSGEVKREYTIKVNVHKLRPDSMAWFSIRSAPMPSSFKAIKDQCTAHLGGTYYCLSTDGSAYCLATTTDPSNPVWSTAEIALPFQANVATLRASQHALYMLATDGALYTSADGRSWSDTGCRWHYIYGEYGSDILGSDASGQLVCAYPSGKSWTMPAGFPVEGTSPTAVYAMPMGYDSQLVMVGGRCADGSLSGSAWGFDGEQWAEVSTKPLPVAMECLTMVAYDMVDVPSSTWVPYDYPVLLAFGGKEANGAVNADMYYSRDWGMTWRLAPNLMQLPEEIPSFYGASAFTYTSTLYLPQARSCAAWTELPLRSLPGCCAWSLPVSRETAPITEWECPAVYLFGGKDAGGNVFNTVWRGVLLQFTFIPIQ